MYRGNILSDFEENKQTTALDARDIFSKSLNESRRNLISKLIGRWRKRNSH